MNLQDKVNKQAASLDLLRSAIFAELQDTLRLATHPWEMPLLKAKLESALVNEGFDQYASRIRTAAEAPDLKDYKLELYLRHFIIEPLLELNYLNIIQTLKDKVTSILIPQFPLSTVVLEPNAQDTYGPTFAGKFQDRVSNGTLEESAAFRLLHGLRMESLLEVAQERGSPLKRTATPSTFGDNPLARAKTLDSDRRARINAFELILKPISTILLNLSVLANFDSPVQIVMNSIKHLESVLRRDPAMADLEKKNISTPSYAYLVLEYNCGLLLDLAMVFAKSTFRKYGIYEYKSPTQFQRLEREFVKHVRDAICAVQKADGPFSPAGCAGKFENVGKLEWLEVKRGLIKELRSFQQRSVFLSSEQRDQVVQRTRETFKDRFMKNLDKEFGFTPRSEILLFNTFEKMRLSCEKSFEAYYRGTQSPPTQLIQELELLANEYLTSLLQPDAKDCLFKSFPKIMSSKFPPSCLLNLNFRQSLVLACLYARLQTSPDIEHTLSIGRLARNLEVHEDPIVAEALEWSKTPTALDQSRGVMYQKSLQGLSDNLRDTDISQIAYLMFSLVIFASGRERDLHELIRAVHEQDIATLTHTSIPRRKAVFEVARAMNNGQYPILNYQMVLLFETVIEKRRIAHNKHMAVRVLKKPPSAFYVAEYSAIFTAFQQMYPKDIAELIISPKSPSQVVIDQQSKFSSSFVEDLVFQPRDPESARFGAMSIFPKTSRPGGPSSLPTVDEDATIAQITETVLLDSYPQQSSFPPLRATRGLMQTQLSITEHTPFGRPNEDRDLRVLGKLQYIKDSVARLDFQPVPSSATGAFNPSRSRSPILCLSGFACEDSDLRRDWGMLSECFPFTEAVAIHWESTKAHKAISQYWTAVKSVSFKTLNQFVIESLIEAIPRKASLFTSHPSLNKPSLNPLHSRRPSNGIPALNGDTMIVPKIALPTVGGLAQVARPSDPSSQRHPQNSTPQMFTLPDAPNDEIPEESARGTDTARLIPTISPELREQFRHSDIRSWKKKEPIDPFTNLQEDNVFDEVDNSLGIKPDHQPLDYVVTQQILHQAAFQGTGRANPGLPGSSPIGPEVLTPELSDEAKKYLPNLALTSGAFDFYSTNPISVAKHQGVVVGQLLALMVGRANLFNKNTPNICAFSLGAVTAHALCCTLYDLSCPNSVGDLLMMGSPLDHTHFGQNIHKLIGSSGVIQGKVTVLFSDRDGFLNYIVRSSRVADQPIGLKQPSFSYLGECLKEHDPDLISQLDQMGIDLHSYVLKRVELVNVTDLVQEHLDYIQNLSSILASVEFAGDLRHFKHFSK